MKSPVIIRVFREGKLVEVKQFDRDQIIFGQDGDVQVALKDEAIAPIHCLIELRDSGYYVCDLGSHTGTFKNGTQILDEPISSGDQIQIGPFAIHFFVGVPKPKAPPTPPAVQAAPPPSAVPAAPSAVPAATPPPVKSHPAVTSASEVTSPPLPPPKLPESPKPSHGGAEARRSPGHKNVKTFAPMSEIKDLRSYLQPGKGPVVEVIVAWKERILSTAHFNQGEKVFIGSGDKSKVHLPSGFLPSDLPFLDVGTSCQVQIPGGAVAELIGSSRPLSGPTAKLDQGEMLVVSLAQGTLQIFVRFVPAAGKPLFAPMLDFSSNEMTGIIATLVMVALTALYMAVYTPPPSEEKPADEQVRVAVFTYNQPKETPTPKPTPTPIPVAEVAKPTPTPEKQKVSINDLDHKESKKGKQDSKAAANETPAARAAEIRPKPSNMTRKTMTSVTDKGAANKTSNTANSGAESKKDVTKMGLMSAFGGGGMRTKLNQATAGAGGILGEASEMTGKTGQNENRSGEDIGSKFKDTGAGGKGTATTGISGIGTKGKSSGQNSYGNVGSGSGKGSVRIEAGGSEEAWSGSIDKEAVRRAVRALIPQIQGCYNKELNLNKSLEGKIIISFSIGEQGRILKASTKSSTMGSPAVEGCVARVIKNGGGFPEPPSSMEVEVSYPFVFSPPN